MVRGVILPSPIELRWRPYNTVTLPCDRVIVFSRLDRGIQSPTEILPLTRGGLLHIVLTAPHVCSTHLLLLLLIIIIINEKNLTV